MFRTTRHSTMAGCLPGVAVLLLALVAMPRSAGAAPTTQSAATCPVTTYTVGTPSAPQTTVASGASVTLTWYGNDALWAGLDRAYRGQWYADPTGVKVLWVRTAPGDLTVQGTRLDGTAPLRADIPHGYGNVGIQASGLIFPTPDCWEVVGRVPGHELRFVVAAHPGSQNPVNGGAPLVGSDVWGSIRRPLHLPVFGPGRDCPGTPARQVTSTTGAAIGEEPAYAAGFVGGSMALGGREEGGWYFWKTLWIASPAYNGPLLIRGGQLDGNNELRFGDGSDPVLELRLPPGSTAVPVTPQGTPIPTNGWTSWPSSTRFQAPGCYAFQVDGWSFSAIIVVLVSDG